jgi:hypothetical protein
MFVGPGNGPGFECRHWDGQGTATFSVRRLKLGGACCQPTSKSKSCPAVTCRMKGSLRNRRGTSSGCGQTPESSCTSQSERNQARCAELRTITYTQAAASLHPSLATYIQPVSRTGHAFGRAALLDLLCNKSYFLPLSLSHPVSLPTPGLSSAPQRPSSISSDGP